MMSDGSKSGVNWTRLNLQPKALAKVFANSVFAKPGKSSNNMLPLDRIPTVTLRKFSFLPMITLLTSPIKLLDIADTVPIKSCEPVGAGIPALGENPASILTTPYNS